MSMARPRACSIKAPHALLIPMLFLGDKGGEAGPDAVPVEDRGARAEGEGVRDEALE